MNLCSAFPYVKAGPLNLNAIVSPYCAPNQVISMTLDLCNDQPRLYGVGDHDKNAFMQATGQCG